MTKTETLERKAEELAGRLEALFERSNTLASESQEAKVRMTQLVAKHVNPLGLVESGDTPATLTKKEQALKADIALCAATLESLPARREEHKAECAIARHHFMEVIQLRVAECKAVLRQRRDEFRKLAEDFATEHVDSDKARQQLAQAIGNFPKARVNVALLSMPRIGWPPDTDFKALAELGRNAISECKKLEAGK